MFVFDDGKSDAEETANTEENGETGETGTSTEESSDKN
jgi:hypothetical protein